MRSNYDRERVVLPGLDADDHELSRVPTQAAAAGALRAKEIAAFERTIARLRDENRMLRQRNKRMHLRLQRRSRKADAEAAKWVVDLAIRVRAAQGIDEQTWSCMIGRPLRRSQCLIEMRQRFVGAMRQNPGRTPSYPEIAAVMGMRSHSSVMVWDRNRDADTKKGRQRT